MSTQREVSHPECTGARATRHTGLSLGLALLLSASGTTPVQADPEGHDYTTSRQFTRPACYELVQDAGRMIAWARWEQRLSREKLQSAKMPDSTPPWIVELVQLWIVDAYEWRATDEQVFQWAAELGNTDRLPRANQLSKHETIAIWMRRIARQCDSPAPHAAAGLRGTDS
jgi:hypothetical protein